MGTTSEKSAEELPSVSVVIPTKNAGPSFEETLQRINEQTYERPVEVVIIDSGSTDDTVLIAEDQGAEVVEIPPDEFHHARTRNRGAAHASNDVLVFTVQDALPEGEEWLSALVAPTTKDDVGAAYGRQVAYPDADPMTSFFYSYFYPPERREVTSGDVEDEARFYLNSVFVSDVSAAIPAETFERLQFDDGVPMSEDKDFALRAMEAGYRIVYTPDAVVRHSHDYSLAALLRRRYKDGKAFGEITGGGGSYADDGMAYLSAEVQYLVRNGFVHWIPYALLYEFVNVLGFQTGRVVGRGE